MKCKVAYIITVLYIIAISSKQLFRDNSFIKEERSIALFKGSEITGCDHIS
jgi:hypothetical protein